MDSTVVPGRCRASTSRVLLWLAPVLVALATYASTLSNGFAYDDEWVLDRLQVGLAGVPWFRLLASGRGLTYALHKWDHGLWGDWAPGFHLTNIVLHATASALAALLAKALSGSFQCALFCGLLFAVHPVHVEAVASFANRKDVLAFVLCALCALQWIRRGHGLRAWIPVVGLYVLALLAKEVASVALPIVLALHASLFQRERAPRLASSRTRISVAVLALCSTAALVAAWVMVVESGRERTLQLIAEESHGRIQSEAEVARACLNATPEIVRLLVFPRTLAAEYPPPSTAPLWSWRTLSSIGLVCALLALPFMLRRRSPAGAYGAAWIVVMVLPTCNVLPVTPYFVQERYLYVPSFGLCLLFGLLVDWACGASATHDARVRRTSVRAVAFVLLCLAAARSVRRNSDWRDTRTLFEAALADGVETAKARSSLGIVCAREHQPLVAIRHFRRALELRPSTEDELSLIVELMRIGRLDEAEQRLRGILARAPDCIPAVGLLEQLRLNRR